LLVFFRASRAVLGNHDKRQIQLQMTKIPSDESVESFNPIYVALEGAFAAAFPVSRLDLDCSNPDQIRNNYITERQGIRWDDVTREAMLSKLPRDWKKYPIGYYEADILDFIANYDHNRILFVLGPRGIGKSSIVQYISNLVFCSNSNEPYYCIVYDGNCEGPNSKNWAWLTNFKKYVIDGLRKISEKERENGRSRDADLILSVFGDIEQSNGEADLFEAFSRLRLNHTSQNPRWITIIFDNLDPLDNDTIFEMQGFCSRLNVKTKLGSILCMRPSTYEYIQNLVGVQTFKRYQVRLKPPSSLSILERMPDKLYAYTKSISSDKMPIINGVTLTPSLAQTIGQRIVDSIKKSTSLEFRQIIRFFDSVSSEDMRHLSALFCRMVAYRNLPRFDKCEDSSDGSDNFHPVTAAIYGGHSIYCRNSLIHNILWTPLKTGGDSYLLAHRILCVLRDQRPSKKTENIFRWLSAYGFTDAEEIIETMDSLRVSHLIYGSDLDKNWTTSNIPISCGLTRSGKFFLNSLLRDPDYLLPVVCSVPLKHELFNNDIKQRASDEYRINLSVSASSLMEYYREVLGHESREIRYMRSVSKPNEYLAYATDCLRHDGTISASIRVALQELSARSLRSKDRGPYQTGKDIADFLISTERSQNNIENALDEILNRCHKYVGIMHGNPNMGNKVDIRGSDGTVLGELHVKQFGLGYQVSARLFSNLKHGISYIQVSGADEKGACLIATSVTSDEYDSEIWQEVARDVLDLWGRQPVIRTISCSDCIQEKSNASPNPTISKIGQSFWGMLTLQMCSSSHVGMSFSSNIVDRFPVMSAISDPFNAVDLRTTIFARLHDLELRIKQKEDFALVRRSIGMELSRYLKREFYIHISQLDRIVLSYSYPKVEIPWEWVLLSSEIQEKTLQTELQFLRFSTVPNRTKDLSPVGIDRPAISFETIDVSNRDMSASDVFAWLDAPGVRHLQCHVEPDGRMLSFSRHGEDLSIFASELDGLPPKVNLDRPSAIVVSGCSFAYSESASIMASKFNCVVLAPLCNIYPHVAKQAAIELDIAIRNSPHSSFVDIFSSLVKSSEVLKLYTMILPWKSQI
jgi:hypothetical protein